MSILAEVEKAQRKIITKDALAMEVLMFAVKSRWDAMRRRMIWLVIKGSQIIANYASEEEANRNMRVMVETFDPWHAFNKALESRVA